MKTQTNNTEINWSTDSLDVIMAKQSLRGFLQEKKEIGGKSAKIDLYHEKRIGELNAKNQLPQIYHGYLHRHL